jgi:hypothetical protein
MTAEALTDRLVLYFAERERQRAEEVARALSRLTAREGRLVREAAVMGYVRGVMAGKVGNDKIPGDLDILAHVVNCCLWMPDLYPVISGEQEPGSSEEGRS